MYLKVSQIRKVFLIEKFTNNSLGAYAPLESWLIRPFQYIIIFYVFCYNAKEVSQYSVITIVVKTATKDIKNKQAAMQNSAVQQKTKNPKIQGVPEKTAHSFTHDKFAAVCPKNKMNIFAPKYLAEITVS